MTKDPQNLRIRPARPLQSGVELQSGRPSAVLRRWIDCRGSTSLALRRYVDRLMFEKAQNSQQLAVGNKLGRMRSHSNEGMEGWLDGETQTGVSCPVGQLRLHWRPF